MDNSETQTPLDTRYRMKKNKTKETTQKTKKMSNTDPQKTRGKPRCARRVSSSCFCNALFKVIIIGIIILFFDMGKMFWVMIVLYKGSKFHLPVYRGENMLHLM